jgi:hypothetical protein
MHAHPTGCTPKCPPLLGRAHGFLPQRREGWGLVHVLAPPLGSPPFACVLPSPVVTGSLGWSLKSNPSTALPTQDCSGAQTNWRASRQQHWQEQSQANTDLPTRGKTTKGRGSAPEMDVGLPEEPGLDVDGGIIVPLVERRDAGEEEGASRLHSQDHGGAPLVPP